jgi:hypothetical protein
MHGATLAFALRMPPMKKSNLSSHGASGAMNAMPHWCATNPCCRHLQFVCVSRCGTEATGPGACKRAISESKRAAAVNGATSPSIQVLPLSCHYRSMDHEIKNAGSTT